MCSKTALKSEVKEYKWRENNLGSCHVFLPKMGICPDTAYTFVFKQKKKNKGQSIKRKQKKQKSITIMRVHCSTWLFRVGHNKNHQIPNFISAIIGNERVQLRRLTSFYHSNKMN